MEKNEDGAALIINKQSVPVEAEGTVVKCAQRH